MLLRPVLHSSAILLALVTSRVSCPAPLWQLQRRRGRSVAFVHALLVVGPLSSFPQINILAAAVSHVSLNSSWQQ